MAGCSSAIRKACRDSTANSARWRPPFTSCAEAGVDNIEAPLLVHPGEWFFGRAPSRVSTLLGSCVAITLRHQAERYAPLREYEIGCFGGSDMFSDKAPSRVGEINVEFAVQWLHRHHLSPSRQRSEEHTSEL